MGSFATFTIRFSIGYIEATNYELKEILSDFLTF